MSLKLNPKILRLEAKLAKAVAKDLRQNNKAIVKIIRSHPELNYLDRQNAQVRKDMLFDIMWEIEDAQKNVVDNIIRQTTIWLQTWYSLSIKQSPVIWEYIATWDIDRASDLYATKVRNLHLSDYKGSILHTTKERVRGIVIEWVQNGDGRDVIAQRIEWLQEQGIFSEARAKVIAQTEMAKAYESWTAEPFDVLHKRWFAIRKRRQTMNDALVRPTHTANQWDGRIPYGQAFSGTWDQIPPWSDGVNCRCHCQYEVEGER